MPSPPTSTASPDPRAALASLRPSHEFLVGIDSDGCAFDTMELKHKECFIPNTIRVYGLQAASKHAREVAEFVNLYSRHRGINRFPSLVLTLDLLRDRPEVVRRGVHFRDVEPLRRWIDSGRPLSNPSLEAEIAASASPELALALEWSQAVNRDVAAMVHGVPPFPGVRECLQKLAGFADALCVSATPVAALTAEWQEHDLARHVRLIAGQEVGSKKDVLGSAIAAGYQPSRVLMVGDAPGDLHAARACGAHFFPIVPASEETSWAELLGAGLDRFRDGTFGGAYESHIIASFLARLPADPPWTRAAN